MLAKRLAPKFEEKTMKKVLFNLLFSVLAFFAIGQSAAKLEGTVRDADSGEPIAIATVALYQNGVLVNGTETDFDGYYSITEIAPGVYDIEFLTTGYAPQRVSGMSIIFGKLNKMDLKLVPGIGYEPIFTCCMCPPLIEIDNTTQGHVFRMEDIRNSPIR